jgi:aspartate carbamoyltransferase catalytic subunit
MTKHIIESQQFDRDYLSKLFRRADFLRHNAEQTLKGKILTTLFYEPSTRTRLSFESAMLRLGGNIIGTEDAKAFSSVSKGETLIDTIRIISKYCDAIVLRHNTEGSSKRASVISEVPVINAGDGRGQHPTQTMLDLYTIEREIGRIDNLKIAMVGDLSNGRTVRSLCYMLGKFRNIEIIFVSPENLKIGQDIKDYLERHNVMFSEKDNLNHVLSNVDVVYMTRIQKERMDIEEYEKAKGNFILDKKNLHLVKEGSIIMHPLPHVEEIDFPSSIEETDRRIAYFRQAENGLFIRMAILEDLMLN